MGGSGIRFSIYDEKLCKPGFFLVNIMFLRQKSRL